jgi:hypothetical protein
MRFYYAESEVLMTVTVKEYCHLGVILCSLVEVYRCFWGVYCLHLQSQSKQSKQDAGWQYQNFIGCLTNSLAMKMEAVCSPKMSLSFYQTAWCHIPECNTVWDFNMLEGTGFFWFYHSRRSKGLTAFCTLTVCSVGALMPKMQCLIIKCPFPYCHLSSGAW